MFSLTRKVDYALIALSELATHREIPLSILTHVLNQLVHSELIASSRGIQGGHTLDPSRNLAVVAIDDFYSPKKQGSGTILRRSVRRR